MAVDWENRINFDRLRKERLDKAKAELKKIGDGRAARLRYEQCPLPDRDDDRHMGAGQDQPVRTALSGRRGKRRTDHMGLRFGGETSSAELPVDGRAVARRDFDVARSDVAGNGPGGKRREEDQNRASPPQPASCILRRIAW